VNKLNEFAKERFGKNVMQLAIRWVLDKTKIGSALVGARKPEQVENLDSVYGWQITQEDMKVIDNILAEEIKNPVGPEFMAPPARK
jgi:aryl-alcohol dehydrogenase-like predicted oxidoreductase